MTPKPLKLNCAQAVNISNKYPSRRWKPVRWKKYWALAKPSGKLVCLEDLSNNSIYYQTKDIKI